MKYSSATVWELAGCGSSFNFTSASKMARNREIQNPHPLKIAKGAAPKHRKPTSILSYRTLAERLNWPLTGQFSLTNPGRFRTMKIQTSLGAGRAGYLELKWDLRHLLGDLTETRKQLWEKS